jgi:hypothetical protein
MVAVSYPELAASVRKILRNSLLSRTEKKKKPNYFSKKGQRHLSGLMCEACECNKTPVNNADK